MHRNLSRAIGADRMNSSMLGTEATYRGRRYADASELRGCDISRDDEVMSFQAGQSPSLSGHPISHRSSDTPLGTRPGGYSPESRPRWRIQNCDRRTIGRKRRAASVSSMFLDRPTAEFRRGEVALLERL